MSKKETLNRIIYEAIDEFNAGLAAEDQLKKDPDELLFDRNGKLDSIGFVNLSTAIETKLESEFGLVISLFGQQFESNTKDPLKTVESLIEYLTGILENQNSNQ